MRAAATAVVMSATLLTPPAGAAIGTVGPFAGAVRQGETRTHAYDNNPLDLSCPLIFARYRVRLDYTPTTDTLTLGIGELLVRGTGGHAEAVFEGGWCGSFVIRVEGTAVKFASAYTVHVDRSPSPGN